MKKTAVPPTTGVVELLREAVDQGRVVVLAADVLSSRPNTEASLVATCRLAFELTGAEARALLKLLRQPHAAREELHAAIARDDVPTTKIAIADVVVHRLRKKLAPRGIKIIAIHGFGYSIDKPTRDEVCKQLAEYGGNTVPVIAPRSEEAHE